MPGEAASARTRRAGCRGSCVSPSSLRSNSSCMPRQMPSTRLAQRRDHASSRPARAGAPSRRRRHRRRAGSRAARAAIAASAVLTSAPRAEPLERELQRGEVGAAAVDDDDVGPSQHALAARQLASLDAERLPQRAADALEAGLDHVVRVVATYRDVQVGAEASASERKKCGTSSVGRPPTVRGRTGPRTPHRRGPRGRSRPGRATRPWAAGSRSARCRACRRAPSQRLAERQRAVLDRVVLVDVQVALADEVRARTLRGVRSARACDRRSRCRSRWRSGRCASRSTSTRMSVSLVLRRTRRVRADSSQRRSRARSRPDRHRAAHPQAPHAEVRGELQVGVAIADHGARCEVDACVRAGPGRPAPSSACGSRSHPRGDAGRRTPRRSRCPGDAKSVQHEAPAARRNALREAGGAEAVLVGDHHEAVARLRSSSSAGDHARHEAHLRERVDLLVGRLLDQRAVAVDEQHAASLHASTAREQAVVLFRACRW